MGAAFRSRLWIALCERTPAPEDKVIAQRRATRDDFNVCGSVVEHNEPTRVFMAAYFDDIVEIAAAYPATMACGSSAMSST
jgi:hypothetical protein